MSKLDGTDEPLSYAAALVAMAERISWQSEEIRNEVADAIREEHGLLPEPETTQAVPAAVDQEKEAMRKRIAELEENARVKDSLASAPPFLAQQADPFDANPAATAAASRSGETAV